MAMQNEGNQPQVVCVTEGHKTRERYKSYKSGKKCICATERQNCNV